MAVAVVTGNSRGLGRALAGRSSPRASRVVIDAGTAESVQGILAGLAAVAAQHGDEAKVEALHGDVKELVKPAQGLGRLDLVVNNAEVLGPSPQPALAAYPLDVLAEMSKAALDHPAQAGRTSRCREGARQERMATAEATLLLDRKVAWGRRGGGQKGFHEPVTAGDDRARPR